MELAILSFTRQVIGLHPDDMTKPSYLVMHDGGLYTSADGFLEDLSV